MKTNFNAGYIQLAAAIVNQANDDIITGEKGYFVNRCWHCGDLLTYDEYQSALKFLKSPLKEYYENIVIDWNRLYDSDSMNIRCSK